MFFIKRVSLIERTKIGKRPNSGGPISKRGHSQTPNGGRKREYDGESGEDDELDMDDEDEDGPVC